MANARNPLLDRERDREKRERSGPWNRHFYRMRACWQNKIVSRPAKAEILRTFWGGSPAFADILNALSEKRIHSFKFRHARRNIDRGREGGGWRRADDDKGNRD